MDADRAVHIVKTKESLDKTSTLVNQVNGINTGFQVGISQRQ